MSTKVAILASGEGTTAEAFIRACTAGKCDADVVLVICNKEGAGIFGRIDRLNQELGLSIETVLVNAKTHPAAADEIAVRGGQTIAEEAAIYDLLVTQNIDIVLSMGYLRKIGPKLVHDFGWQDTYTNPAQARMFNTHPGLLPETKGLWGIHVQEHVIEAGLPVAGQTFHVVAEDYDEGPILAEYRLNVEPNETADHLFDRVKASQNEKLPGDMQALIMARTQYLQTS